jgi:hypothetical protein
MLEKLALLKIALCRAAVVTTDSSARGCAESGADALEVASVS